MAVRPYSMCGPHAYPVVLIGIIEGFIKANYYAAPSHYGGGIEAIALALKNRRPENLDAIYGVQSIKLEVLGV